MILGAVRFLIFASYLVATSTAQMPAESLVLDSARPFVYIEFDHKGERHTPDGNVEALWLNIVNNSSIPIEINAYSKGGGGHDVGINYRVVLTPEGRLKYLHNSQAVPSGHTQDVSGVYTIAPGEKLKFTISASDVSQFWYILTTCRFSLPRKMTGNDPTLDIIFTSDQITGPRQPSRER